MQHHKTINVKKSLIIHLDRAAARQEQVERIKSAIPFETEVVSAIDSQSSNEENCAAYGRYSSRVLQPVYPQLLSKSEIACFRSHRKCWQEILNQNLDAALILEDDVELDVNTFPGALELVMSAIKVGDFVRFPYKEREKKGKVISSNGEIVLRLPQRIALGMQVQLVTRDAARRLLEQTAFFDRPVDCFLQMPWEHGARVLSVWPSGVKEISAELGGSMIRHKEYSLKKVKREFLRPLYRLQISSLACRYFKRDF